MKQRITNVTVYPITQTPLKADVWIEDGVIQSIGDWPGQEADETIDGKGGLLFPGFIDAHSHIGLAPEGQGLPYDDTNEASEPVTPDVRALDAYTPVDLAFREAARGGVMIYCVLPGSANPIGGLGSIFHYSRSNLASDQILRADCYLKMATGENPKVCYGEKKVMPSTRMGVAAVMRKFLNDGRNYIQKKKTFAQKAEDPEAKQKVFAETDPRMEVAEQLLKKEIGARIHCHRAEDILTALRIAREFEIDICIEHATEFYKVHEEVKKAGVPIVIGPLVGFRSKVELRDATLAAYSVAEREEILFASMSDHPVIPAETLRLQAGMAVQYGASEEAMLKSMTIYAAKILDLDQEYGSIEVGKKSSMCIWDGHPFHSNRRVIWNSVDGWDVYEPKI